MKKKKSKNLSDTLTIQFTLPADIRDIYKALAKKKLRTLNNYIQYVLLKTLDDEKIHQYRMYKAALWSRRTLVPRKFKGDNIPVVQEPDISDINIPLEDESMTMIYRK